MDFFVLKCCSVVVYLHGNTILSTYLTSLTFHDAIYNFSTDFYTKFLVMKVLLN